MNIPEYIKTLLLNYYDEKTVLDILEGYKTKRFQSFRVNTLKAAKEEIITVLNENSIKYEEWNVYNQAFIVEDDELIRTLDIYKDGKIYFQSLSSMLPPLFLNGHGDILDMTAAPGSKTSMIAGLDPNSMITAVEIDKIRMERLKYNMNKLGVKNITYLNTDASKLDDFFSFDSILLDAPCSGSGTLNIYDKSFDKFSLKLVKNSSIIQKKLLSKSLTILKRGHEMVYSTCSILPEENEQVVSEIIKRFNCEIVPLDKSVFNESDLLPTKIEGSICLKPNKYYEGFFIVKIKKN